jgi:hypothetical protein
MAILEAEQDASHDVLRIDSVAEGRKWSQIYSYSYSQSLTGCVQQLEQLQRYTKEIVGEQGFDLISPSFFEDSSRQTGTRHGELDGDDESDGGEDRP